MYKTCSHCGKIRKKVNIKHSLLIDIVKLKEVYESLSNIEHELYHMKKTDNDLINIKDNINKTINSIIKIIKD